VRTFSWPEPGGSRHGLAGRVSWGLADQGLSSLTNFGLSLVVARHVGVRELGAFSLVFTTYLMALGISRSLCSDPMMVRYSAAGEQAWREGAPQATGAAVGFGVAAGLGCLVLGAAVGGQIGTTFAVLGVTLPGLLLQDCWRFAFIASGRSGYAFVNDLIWAAVMFPVLGFALASGRDSLAWFTAAWGVAGCAAALGGVVQAGILPWPWNPLGWWRRHRDLNLRFLGEFGATSGISQLTKYGVGVVDSLATVGVLRAGELLIGPFYIMFMGGNSVVTAEGARILRRSPERLVQLSTLYSTVLAAATVAWGAAVLLLPPTMGAFVLGSSWPAARTVAVPFLLIAVAMAAMAGPMTGLRALAAARSSLRARLVAAPLTAVAGLSGAALAGARGAAWGMAVGGWIGAGIWWRRYRQELATRQLLAEAAP
jgi:hypothetical protein